MTLKQVQTYQNSPDMGESTNNTPNPPFKDMSGYRKNEGFFTIDDNVNNLDLNSKRYEDLTFQFMHGESEYHRLPMANFKPKEYCKNHLDGKGNGLDKGRGFWDNNSDCHLYKKFGPAKRVGYITGMTHFIEGGSKISDWWWSNGKVLPIRGCVGWSGYVQATTTFTKGEPEHWGIVGLYVVMCNKNREIKLAELTNCERTYASGGSDSIYGKAWTVDYESNSPATFLTQSNVKDAYCGFDMGNIERSHSYQRSKSPCSEEVFYTPKDLNSKITYCFSGKTQKKIYDEKWVPVAMIFYVGLQNGSAFQKECSINFTRNKLLYLPQTYSPGTVAVAGMWGMPYSGRPDHVEPDDYLQNNQNASQKSLMMMPELVYLKNYWTTINGNKQQLALTPK